MNIQAAFLCAAVAIFAKCEAGILRDEIRPDVETDLELTADDSDTGNWTANLGDLEINIEHRHQKVTSNSSGTWTLDIARTTFQKEENSEESKNIYERDNIIDDIVDFKKPIVEEDSLSGTTMAPEEDETVPPEQLLKRDNDNEIPVEITQPILFHGRPAEIIRYPDGQYNIVTPLYADQNEVRNENNYDQYDDIVTPAYEEQKEDSIENGDSDEVILDPDNFEYFKGIGWFKLDDRHMNWDEAAETCAQVGAHLSVPDSKERVNVFLTLFKRHSEIPANAALRNQAYVGVSDPNHKREFTTVQGKPFNPGFPIWFVNEPDNADPGEDCITFHTEGRTRDVPCFYRLPFFCEKDVPMAV